jgi:molybdopterin-binding protein
MTSKRKSSARIQSGEILTAREAAQYLRLTLPTFYRYLRENKIEASRVGGRYRFKKSLLNRWLGQQPVGEEVSGRNKFVGKVSSIKRDAVLAQINLEVGEIEMTAVITCDAVDALRLKFGDTVTALVKATDVMLIKER